MPPRQGTRAGFAVVESAAQSAAAVIACAMQWGRWSERGSGGGVIRRSRTRGGSHTGRSDLGASLPHPPARKGRNPRSASPRRRGPAAQDDVPARGLQRRTRCLAAVTSPGAGAAAALGGGGHGAEEGREASGRSREWGRKSRSWSIYLFFKIFFAEDQLGPWQIFFWFF